MSISQLIKDILYRPQISLSEALTLVGVHGDLVVYCGDKKLDALISEFQLCIKVFGAMKVRPECSESIINQRVEKRIYMSEIVSSVLKIVGGGDIGVDKSTITIEYKNVFNNCQEKVTLSTPCDANLEDWMELLNKIQVKNNYVCLNTFQTVVEEKVNLALKFEVKKKKETKFGIIDNDSIIGDPVEIKKVIVKDPKSMANYYNAESKFVQTMSTFKATEFFGVYSPDEIVNEVLPLARLGNNDSMYNVGFRDEDWMDRSHIRLHRWTVICENIPEDKRDEIVILGASRYCLSLYKRLKFSVCQPQSMDEFKQEGLEVCDVPTAKEYCLIDPFSGIYNEGMFVKDEEKKRDLELSSFENSIFSGRLVRASFDKSNILVDNKELVYVPFIFHKAEYYSIHEDLVGNLLGWKSDSRGVLNNLVNFKNYSGDNKVNSGRCSASTMILINNLIRNRLILLGIKDNGKDSYIKFLEVFISRENDKIKQDSTYVLQKHKFLYVQLQYYRLYYYNCLRSCLDNLTQAKMLGDCYDYLVVRDLLINGRMKSIKSLYYTGNVTRRRINNDSPRVLNMNLNVDDQGRAFLNRNDWNLGNYTYVNDFNLGSYKDDVYLKVSNNKVKYNQGVKMKVKVDSLYKDSSDTDKVYKVESLGFGKTEDGKDINLHTDLGVYKVARMNEQDQRFIDNSNAESSWLSYVTPIDRENVKKIINITDIGLDFDVGYDTVKNGVGMIGLQLGRVVEYQGNDKKVGLRMDDYSHNYIDHDGVMGLFSKAEV